MLLHLDENTIAHAAASRLQALPGAVGLGSTRISVEIYNSIREVRIF